MLLEGKKAVVTGGTRGIGFAIVETFLKNGASVALFGSRQETVDKALAKLKAENPDWDVIGMAPDLTDYAAVDAAMAKVTEAFGRIDILVNNAGISAREPLYQYDPAAFKNIMDLNVTAVFNGCRAVAPIMKAQGGGSIINTSSMVSLNIAYVFTMNEVEMSVQSLIDSIMPSALPLALVFVCFILSRRNSIASSSSMS